MTKIRAVCLLTLFSFLLGCNDSMENNHMNNNDRQSEYMYYEVDILPKLIDLPGTPKYIRWKVIEDKNTGNGSLTALIEFSKDDYDKVMATSRPTPGETSSVVSFSIYNDWFTEELKSIYSHQNGSDIVKLQGSTAYDPNQFVNSDLSSYIHGYIVLLESNFVFISLYSM